MKNIYLLVTVLLSFITLAKAQTEEKVDYCVQISRDTDAAQGIRTYQSPEGRISIKNQVSAAGSTAAITFSTKEFALYEEEGLFIRFTDHHTLRFFGQHIEHKNYSPLSGYTYDTVLTLTPEQLEIFKTKKISVFQIASIDVEVDDDIATAFQAYVNCITGLK